MRDPPGTTCGFGRCPEHDRGAERFRGCPYPECGFAPVCQVLKGSLDQSDQAFLDDAQMEEGYCLLCVSYPTSDLTIKTHCEEELQ